MGVLGGGGPPFKDSLCSGQGWALDAQQFHCSFACLKHAVGVLSAGPGVVHHGKERRSYASLCSGMAGVGISPHQKLCRNVVVTLKNQAEK